MDFQGIWLDPSVVHACTVGINLPELAPGDPSDMSTPIRAVKLAHNGSIQISDIADWYTRLFNDRLSLLAQLETANCRVDRVATEWSRTIDDLNSTLDDLNQMTTERDDLRLRLETATLGNLQTANLGNEEPDEVAHLRATQLQLSTAVANLSEEPDEVAHLRATQLQLSTALANLSGSFPQQNRHESFPAQYTGHSDSTRFDTWVQQIRNYVRATGDQAGISHDHQLIHTALRALRFDVATYVAEMMFLSPVDPVPTDYYGIWTFDQFLDRLKGRYGVVE